MQKELSKKIDKLGWIYKGTSVEEFVQMKNPPLCKSDKINTAKFQHLQNKVKKYLDLQNCLAGQPLKRKTSNN